MLTLAVLAAIGLAIFGFAPVKADDTDTNISTSAGALEKILSPDQIKYFKVIKKENGSLYGIRLSAAVKNQTTEQAGSDAKENLSTAKAQLEKILAPQFISLYEKIQKIGNSLWGVKKSTDDTSDEVKLVLSPRLVTSAMIECVSAAIDKKDEALKNRITVSAEAVNAAIGVRGECQKSAIKTTDNQAAALQVCVKDFRAKSEEIMKQSKAEQQIIWKAYQADLKECSALDATVSSEEEGDEFLELMIEDGGSASMEAVLNQ